jgi:hypothetical protein
LYAHFQRLSAAIVDVARNQQVASALRRFNPAAATAGTSKPQVVSIGRQSPALSEAGFATSAFLLREFREIDYLAGILDAQSIPGQETWISQHADVQLLHDFYGSPLSVPLGTEALVGLVDACLPKPSAMALALAPWGRRCLLAGAARQAAEAIQKTCGEKPASDACEKAAEFAALGKAAKDLEDAAEKKKKHWQFVSGIREDIQEQLELLSDRIDEMVQNQRSFLAVPSRALDVGMEALFIDGLQFLPTVYSDEKDLRVVRGRWNPLGSVLTDLRFVIDRPFLAIEASRRWTPRFAGALEVGGGWELGIGVVPALSLGAGLGCSNDGHLTWFQCKAVTELLEDGSFRAPPSDHFAMAYGDLSAELFTLNHPVVSFHLGPLLTAHGGYVWSSDRPGGIGLEAGGFLRVGLARMVSLDFRLVTGLPVRSGANVSKSPGTADFIFAAGWKY